jgi:hypothetical protein
MLRAALTRATGALGSVHITIVDMTQRGVPAVQPDIVQTVITVSSEGMMRAQPRARGSRRQALPSAERHKNLPRSPDVARHVERGS